MFPLQARLEAFQRGLGQRAAPARARHAGTIMIIIITITIIIIIISINNMIHTYT